MRGHAAGAWQRAHVSGLQQLPPSWARAVPGLPARVVNGPVPCSAAIGSEGHTPKAVLTSPLPTPFQMTLPEVKIQDSSQHRPQVRQILAPPGGAQINILAACDPRVSCTRASARSDFLCLCAAKRHILAPFSSSWSEFSVSQKYQKQDFSNPGPARSKS